MSERVIDEGREWRNFSDSDKDRSRAEGVDEFINELTTDISRAPNLSGDLARMSKVQNRIAVGVLLQKHLIG
jgi:transcription initiation factor TFIIIB Brf1 subunit/transcription initiation factor TFIIB